jgi:hypothetical protein
VLKYDLDEVYKGRTIRQILREVGVSIVWWLYWNKNWFI